MVQMESDDLIRILEMEGVPYERREAVRKMLREMNSQGRWPAFNRKTGPGVDGPNTPVEHRTK